MEAFGSNAIRLGFPFVELPWNLLPPRSRQPSTSLIQSIIRPRALYGRFSNARKKNSQAEKLFEKARLLNPTHND